jgi:CBS-domain-containing membrane protein
LLTLANMSKTVRDIMNPKLLYIRDGDRVALAKKQILSFGVTAVPILDETHRPVGIVSLRDLEREGDHVAPTALVETVKDTDTVEVAARKLADTEYHHLVVVDDKGVAVGMVSSVDFLRALLGMEPRHPKAFDNF